MDATDISIPASAFFIVALFFLPMLFEARRAARHERLLLARGGIEPAGDVYHLMQVAYPGVFVVMLIEHVRRHADATPVLFAVGLGIFLVGKLLKWWAILSLGPYWTFRIIVMPQSESVSRGPYRFLTHPNYVGVVGELIGGALMTAAPISGPLGLGLFSALMLRRASVESRARDAILRQR